MKKLLVVLFVTSISLNSIFANNIKADDSLPAYLLEMKQKADSGDAVSQNDIGHIFLYGMPRAGIFPDKKNIGIGIDYLYKAAWQDQVNAMTTLGWESFTGKIMNKNDKEAFDWNKKASDLGFTIASYNIGFFYYSGLGGVKKDLVKAKQYWELSASQWITSTNRGGTMPEELLDEINEYNKNPTNEMIKLRDWYIGILNSIES